MGRRKMSEAVKLKYEEQCLELHIQGLPYRQIAKAIGIDLRLAHKHVKDAKQKYIDSVMDKAKDVVTSEIERLDKALYGLRNGIKNGDPKSVVAMIKIMERRAKYLKLDAPEDDPLARLPNDLESIEAELIARGIKLPDEPSIGRQPN